MGKRLSGLRQLGKVFLLGTAVHFGAGCGALQVSYSDELIRKRNVVAPIDFDLEGILSKANKLLVNFPSAEKINQDLEKKVVRSIDRYLTPSARYLLVHIRQMHDVKNSSEEDKEQVIDIQNDIYQFLDYLREDPNIKLRKVYSEGYLSGPEYYHLESEISFYRLLDFVYTDVGEEFKRKVRNLENDPSVGKEEIEVLKSRIRSLEEDKKKLILYGAEIKLGAERKLAVLPAEKFDMPDEIGLISREGVYAIMDNRENGFLEIASGQRCPLVLVIYGGLHAWGGKDSCGADYNSRLSLEDNIAIHNAEHPNRKFSLIEVVVDSYQETPEEDIKLIMDSLH